MGAELARQLGFFACRHPLAVRCVFEGLSGQQIADLPTSSGSSSASLAAFWRRRSWTAVATRTTKNIAKATMTKLMTEFRNGP